MQTIGNDLYRSSIRTTWKFLLPPVLFIGAILWFLTDPANRSDLPKLIGAIVGLLLCLPFLLFGLAILFRERLYVEDEGMEYHEVSKPTWYLEWEEIHSLKLQRSVARASTFTVIIASKRGEKRIRTDYIVISGQDLADEICRRTGKPLIASK